MKKVLRALLTAAALCVWMAAGAAAAETLPVLEQNLAGREDIQDIAVLYVPYKGAAGSVQVRIGQTDLTARVGEENPKVVTWMLFDNSLSIPNADGEKARAVFQSYCENKIPAERVSLCTFSGGLARLTADSDDSSELSGRLDGVQYEGQEASVLDALDELLNIEASREGIQYVRVLVFSDGAGSSSRGITWESLLNRLGERNIPIYTIGCGTDQAALERMYSISSQTGGKSWNLSDVDSATFDPAFRYGEAPAVIRVSIPEDLWDGSVQSVQLTLPDGSRAEARVQMPEQQTPPPPPPPKIDLVLILIAAGCLVLVIGITVCVILLVRRRSRDDGGMLYGDAGWNRPSSGGIWGRQADAMSGPGGFSATEIMNAGAGQQYGEKTQILVSGESADLRNMGGGMGGGYMDEGGFRMLALSDLNHPERHFEVPLRGRVSIGRRPSNMIVLDYDSSVSGSHCEIYTEGGSCCIRDLNSTNGTFADDLRVSGPTEISSGSTIRLGRLMFRVTIQ